MVPSSTGRPTLDAWLAEYADIEKEYREQFESWGVSFESEGESEAAAKPIWERLRAKGARFRNAGASISIGALSSACVACTGDRGSRTFYLSLACNRDCFFCFNSNQENFEADLALKDGWEDELEEFLHAETRPTHVALTGGEPLLFPERCVAFFRKVRDFDPRIHTRLYTDGDFLDDGILAGLAEAGLREIRLSVKCDPLDDTSEAVSEALGRVRMAKRHISDVMVEMPVIPGTEEEMKELMAGMEDAGAFGINLLEFCYPLNDWRPYAMRGLEVKNPPFEILYDYEYAGGLPIATSEVACLRLMEWALDNGMRMGVHYCSLDNKNRDQILRLDSVDGVDDSLYMLDEGDFFYKTLKVFDRDVAPASVALAGAGRPFSIDGQDGSLLCHPSSLDALEKAGDIVVALSTNVVAGDCESDSSAASSMRELGLALFERRQEAEEGGNR